MAIFGNTDCILKGFYKESPLSRYANKSLFICEEIYQNIPQYLFERLLDDAIEYQNVTFCYWQEASGIWIKSEPKLLVTEDDGEAYLKTFLSKNISQHLCYIEDYYEIELNEDFKRIIKYLRYHVPISYEMLDLLCIKLQKKRIIKELQTINYPILN